MSIVAESQPSRQGYVSAVALVGPGVVPLKAGEVQPAYLSSPSLVRCAAQRGPTGGWAGVWLDLACQYQRPGAAAYQLSLAAFIGRSGCAERVFLRSCSCPDGAARAASGAAGEMRLCKHLVCLRAVLSGQPVRLGSALFGAFVDAVARGAAQSWGAA